MRWRILLKRRKKEFIKPENYGDGDYYGIYSIFEGSSLVLTNEQSKITYENTGGFMRGPFGFEPGCLDSEGDQYTVIEEPQGNKNGYARVKQEVGKYLYEEIFLDEGLCNGDYATDPGVVNAYTFTFEGSEGDLAIADKIYMQLR